MIVNLCAASCRLLVFCALVAMATASVSAQSTAFTYQGKLNDTSNPSGTVLYDLQFNLFSVPTGGSPFNNSPVIAEDVSVTNGIFSTLIDFGSNHFTSGGDRYLEIAMRPGNSTGSFTVLNPRQQLTSSPYSIRALSAAGADVATNANNLGGVAAGNYVQTTDARLNNATITFNVVNNGFSSWQIGNPGDYVSGSNNNPTLVLMRGVTYKFNVSVFGHPFRIASSDGGPAFNTGITNNDVQGGVLTFKVPMDAPDTLYYYCLFHPGTMKGTIRIVGSSTVTLAQEAKPSMSQLELQQQREVIKQQQEQLLRQQTMIEELRKAVCEQNPQSAVCKPQEEAPKRHHE